MSSTSSTAADRIAQVQYRVEAPRANQQWGTALSAAFDPGEQLPDEMQALLGRLDLAGRDRLNR